MPLMYQYESDESPIDDVDDESEDDDDDGNNTPFEIEEVEVYDEETDGFRICRRVAKRPLAQSRNMASQTQVGGRIETSLDDRCNR
jgi:hypothetical protein